MTPYIQFNRYTGVFSPRQNDEYTLKSGLEALIGQRMLLEYIGPVMPDEDDRFTRHRYLGEHEFQVHSPQVEGLPTWVTDRDLTDIQPAHPWSEK